jgi:hypothetical protein
MHLPTKLQMFANFLPQKMLQPFIIPLYSPGLPPPEYFLFPKLKMKLTGLHFADIAEIQEALRLVVTGLFYGPLVQVVSEVDP